MRKFLILSAWCLIAFSARLHAQIPSPIVIKYIPANQVPQFSTPDGVCNAGTLKLEQHVGQSNDVDEPIVYLCFGDQIFINHDGNAQFMDPQPATSPGVGYVFYSCPPTVTGPDGASVSADPCVFRGGNPPNIEPLVATNSTGNPPDASGDLLLRNLGILQSTYNNGQPIQFWFAPTTLDDFTNRAWEVVNGNTCVNVNVSEAFSVVYLNDVVISGINPNAGGGCLGRFNVRGGLPQFDPSTKYTIDISLSGNPNVKALIHNQPTQFNHDATIYFSVSQPGVYNITIEDGKSCGASAQVNMITCDIQNNLTLTAANVNVAPGGQICAPVTVQNFNDLLGLTFNLQWDNTIVSFVNLQNIHPSLQNFANNVQILPNPSGLSFSYFAPPNVTSLNIPDGQTLFELCYTALGQLGDCSPIRVVNFPAQVDVTDSQGELAALTFVNGSVCIGNNQLVVNVAPQNSCNTPGSIVITATSGTPPFDITYLGPTGASSGSGAIGTPGGSFTVNNLPGGNYTVTVVDGAGKVSTQSVTLEVIDLAANLVTAGAISCNGNCDGSMAVEITLNGVTVNNPGSNYQFVWSPSQLNLPNAATVTNLCAGSYAVTVTNTQNNCTTSASGSLGQPPIISQASVSTIDASCTDVPNGTITFLAQGGSPFPGGDYQFNWSYSPTGTNPQPVPLLNQTTNPVVANNVPSGFYFVTITDSRQCTATTSIELKAAKTLSMTAAQIQNVSCFGGSDGVASIQVNTNPQAPNLIAFWDYQPQASGSIPTFGATSITVSGLPAGQYTFTAVDTAGCSVVNVFDVGAPPAINLSTTVVNNPTCAQPTSGAVVLNFPSGGIPPFTYRWNNPAMSTTPNVSNLEAGTYTVTVTDANQCTNTLSVTLVLPPPPPVSGFDSTSVKCGNDGCLRVNVAGGPYTYTWSNLGTGSVVGNTAQVCNLNGGQYIIVVRDAQNCTFRDTLNLVGKAPLIFADTLIDQPSCFGDTDGNLSTTIGGGTAPYNFTWSNGSTNQVLVNIAAGIYSLTVTDLNDCSLTGTFALPNPPAIAVTFNNIAAANCDNECSGRATAIANYATTPPTSGNFSFRWSDNPSINLAQRTNLCAGILTVTVTDANNCFTVEQVFIDAPPPVFADTFYTIPARCFGESNGAAAVNGAGGNGAPYTYDWGNNLPQLPLITNLRPGQYVATIFDNRGCTGTQILVVSEPDPVRILKDDLISQDIICNGTDSGVLGVSVSGGNQNQGALTYQWSDGSNIIGNTPIVDGLGAGQYFITVTDPLGCSGTAGPFTLENPPPVQGSYLPWEALKCFGEQTTLYINQISGGTGGPYQFSLDYGVTLTSDFPVSMGGGKHIITYFDRVGCSSEDTIVVDEPAQILVNFNPSIVEIELGDSTDLRPLITGAAVDKFEWKPTIGLSDINSLNPFVTTFTSQTYTLTVYDANGCSGVGQVRVDVDPNRNVFIPNVFNPSSTSGRNDRFNVYVGAGVKNINYMQVFDRWGEKVYERRDFFPNNNDFSEGWDGNYRGRKMGTGIYVYIIEVEFLDGLVLLYRGDVALMR